MLKGPGYPLNLTLSTFNSHFETHYQERRFFIESFFSFFNLYIFAFAMDKCAHGVGGSPSTLQMGTTTDLSNTPRLERLPEELCRLITERLEWHDLSSLASVSKDCRARFSKRLFKKFRCERTSKDLYKMLEKVSTDNTSNEWSMWRQVRYELLNYVLVFSCFSMECCLT
jgi:hypothetical protein